MIISSCLAQPLITQTRIDTHDLNINAQAIETFPMDQTLNIALQNTQMLLLINETQKILVHKNVSFDLNDDTMLL